ncbi:MAG: primosomal protein N' [Clostridia bacterium]|nr:primosomal protein N' [Clostridia bacterium]
MTVCVKVHILDVPYHADCEYDYYASSDIAEEIDIGSLVIVPFGAANRQKVALVTGYGESVEYETNRIKHIISSMSSCLSLTEEMMALCRFMKSTTLCTIGDAVKCMVPTMLVSKVEELLYATDKEYKGEEHKGVYEYILKKPGITANKLSDKLEGARDSVSWLVRNKYVSKKAEITERDKARYERVVSLAIDKSEALDIATGKKKLRSKKQENIIALLCEISSLTDREIYERTGSQKQQLDGLLEKGYIKIDKIRVDRDPYAEAKTGKRDNIVLSEEQKRAYEQLEELYSSGEAKAALLYGVTGSGKTSVIKEMIDRVIVSGRSVIILVPEISLTPQTVSMFCGYYGERVAVIHSGLSTGERFDSYRKIRDGEIDVVIGTRSAIFAPLSNLGMIVIDEEQEHTYKSDTDPKYLAHDIARFRCAKSNALMLLASATPSLTSYYKAVSGVYSLVKLTKRYGEATLPDVIITDMHRERAAGNTSVFGTKLATMLGEIKEDNKQAILFLNRRGYHASLSCSECGKPVECPNCSVAMTYHSFRKIEEDITADNAYDIMSASGVLRCHYCGYQTRVPKVCPDCKEGHLEYVGFGTQKLEGDIERLLPDIKTIRMDADTTTQKSSYEKILSSFLNKEADVLIGTQMVTKGHNFPYVTVVGVMLADMMLYTSDYRAAERTFSMLTQVIGRAGRAKDKGIAVIQTNSPSDRTIQYAATQNYEEFYKNEIQIRKAFTFPPYCDIALITLSSGDEYSLDKEAMGLLSRLKKDFTEAGAPVIAYGPFEAPVYRTQGRYRKRIIIKCRLDSRVRNILGKAYSDFSRDSAKVRISFDFNPSSL